MYIDLFHRGSPKDGINWGYNEQINGFVSGVTPFLLQDPDAIPFINQMLGEDKYSVVPAPVGPFGFAVLDYGFNGLGIPSYSEYKEEAWKFISWIAFPSKMAISTNTMVPYQFTLLRLRKTSIFVDHIIRHLTMR